SARGAPDRDSTAPTDPARSSCKATTDPSPSATSAFAGSTEGPDASARMRGPAAGPGPTTGVGVDAPAGPLETETAVGPPAIPTPRRRRLPRRIDPAPRHANPEEKVTDEIVKPANDSHARAPAFGRVSPARARGGRDPLQGRLRDRRLQSIRGQEQEYQ